MVHKRKTTMKSTSDNIFSFLQANPSTFIAADLERRTFLNNRGNPSSPKSIRNRLQDLARDGKISVEEKGGFAYYSIHEAHKKKPVLVIDEDAPPIKVNGQWRAQLKMV